MSLEIVEVKSKKEIKKFIDFPHDLYQGDPNYVPELHIAQREMFDKKKYPFYEYGEAIPYLAYQNGKIVGRICAISNHRYNDYHGSNIGFFGFFDCIDDPKVSSALLDKVKEYHLSKNYAEMMGPTNFTTNETAGTLVDGFHEPSKIMLTYNHKYYGHLLESYGFKKEMDLYAYMIYTKQVSEKSLRLSKMLEDRLGRQGICIRNLNLKNFKKETALLKEVYNEAWENNWGFVPFTDAEFEHLADGLKMLADEKFAYIAEHNGKPVGFGISLPNIHEITINFKKGRLLPFNIFKLLLRKKKVKTVRILALGIVESYRKKGIEAIFFAKNIEEAKKRDLLGGEASWILESNQDMVAAAEKLNGDRYKTYRIYKKSI